MSAGLLCEAANSLRVDSSVAYQRGHMPMRMVRFNRAVADWLDTQANDYDRYEGIWAESHKDPRNRWGDLTPERNLEHHFGKALDVARAYLGRDA